MDQDVCEDLSAYQTALSHQQTTGPDAQARTADAVSAGRQSLSTASAALETQMCEVTGQLSEDLATSGDIVNVVDKMREAVTGMLDASNQAARSAFDAVVPAIDQAKVDMQETLAAATDALAQQCEQMGTQIRLELAEAASELGRIADADASRLSDTARTIEARLQDVTASLCREVDAQAQRITDLIDSLRNDPTAQFAAGMVTGVVAGATPGGAIIAPIAEATNVEENMPEPFRQGYGIGEALEGASQMAAGGAAMVAGAALDATGPGAVAGVPLNAAGAAMVAEGASDVAVGIRVYQNATTKPAGASTSSATASHEATQAHVSSKEAQAAFAGRFSEHPALDAVWKKASEPARSFAEARSNFWSEVNQGTSHEFAVVRDILHQAGYELRGADRAPVLREAGWDHSRASRELSDRLLTIDHAMPQSIERGKAMDSENLRFMTGRDNAVRGARFGDDDRLR